MKLDQVIALIASIASALSALATFMTIREMAKQRRASYRPELVFEGKPFTLVGADIDDKNPKSALPIWSDETGAPSRESVFVNLLNIGLGAAKSVTLNFSFDEVQLVKDVNEASQRNLIMSFVEYSKGMITLRSNIHLDTVSMWRNQKIRQIDYLLPSQDTAQSVSVDIPHAYSMLVSLLFLYRSKSNNIESFYCPPLDVEVNYGDLGEKKISTGFRINYNISLVKDSPFYASGEMSVSLSKKSSFSQILMKEAISSTISKLSVDVIKNSFLGLLRG